jgi:hypothetical protein
MVRSPLFAGYGKLTRRAVPEVVQLTIVGAVLCSTICLRKGAKALVGEEAYAALTRRRSSSTSAQSHSYHSSGNGAPSLIPIPLHRRKPVPTAKVDPGLRRESAERTSELHQLNESVH